jgi:hypothetical protein
MSTAPHPMALRAPWYACERAGLDRFDPRSLAPVIQKYDRDDFVAQLVADPSASLKLSEADDVWTFAVRRVPGAGASMRQLLSPYDQVPSGIRKLYQPSHQRFYAVAVELFCDQAGLPLPGPGDDTTVRFVVRRLNVTVTDSDPHRKNLKELAKLAGDELFGRNLADLPAPHQGPAVDDDTASDLFGLYRLQARDPARFQEFEQQHRDLFAQLTVHRQVQGWYVDKQGKGSWQPVPLPAGPAVQGDEQEYPMWRVPRPADDCVPDPGRSIWFGAVPTYSADLDADGRPKLDESHTYVIRCVARRPRPAPPDCPPVVTWSAPTEPFRLAAFFDPAGTANRRIHVRLPDFAAVAAQAGKGPLAGGVQFERPANSQLPVGNLGDIPKPNSGAPGGATAEICVFAIELITIVASFVLSLFMPIVIFAFQLWWLLLLKFCWPPSADVNGLLDVLGTQPGGLSIDGLALGSPAERALRSVLGTADDHRTDLFKPDPNGLTPDATGIRTDRAQSKEFAGSLEPENPPETPRPVSLPPVTDPFCSG